MVLNKQFNCSEAYFKPFFRINSHKWNKCLFCHFGACGEAPGASRAYLIRESGGFWQRESEVSFGGVKEWFMVEGEL